jgi:dipeptidyl-peptidase-4
MRDVKTCRLLLVAVIFAAPWPCAAADPATLTVERIFAGSEFNADSAPASEWQGEDGRYTSVEASETLKSGADIVQTDPETGERSVLVKAERLVPEGAQAPLSIGDYQWSDDRRYLLIFTNTKKFRRHDSLGDYWLLDLEDGLLRQIGDQHPTSSLMYATFSPDSRRIAYVSGNNLYVEDAENGRTTQITSDGSDVIFNGIADWAYEEEFYFRSAYRWSPDSRRIAFWRFDANGVETFYMVKNTGGQYAELIPLQYPKPGSTNSAAAIGVVELRNREIRWIDLPGDPRQNYIPYMDWAANSEELAVQHMNRKQNTNRLLLINASTGALREILTERDDAWIDVNYGLRWLNNGETFTWLSERDGWLRFYLGARSDGALRPISPPQTDIISVEHIDEAGGWLYYLASPDDNAARYLYRISLDGGAPERLTPADQPGTHRYDIEPDAGWAFHTYSMFDTPPVTELIRLPDHSVARELIDNAHLRSALEPVRRGQVEFFRVGIEDGVNLDGWMMYPPEFDPSEKYPLLFYVYSEPAGQTVRNAWGGKRYLWHLMLAQKGYLVASIDSRGTPAPRGRTWRKSIYGQIGTLASADQAAAAQALIAGRSYIDRARIGIWGKSGGGSMTLNMMFRHPDIYRVGLSLAAVSDQRLYNSIYQERYMGLPEENEEGYRLGSPVNWADQLEGDLFVAHGTADDNVHYQSLEVLIDRLIAHNKKFSMMAYPDRSHALSEKANTERHLYETMTEFLLERL